MLTEYVLWAAVYLTAAFVMTRLWPLGGIIYGTMTALLASVTLVDFFLGWNHLSVGVVSLSERFLALFAGLCVAHLADLEMRRGP